MVDRQTIKCAMVDRQTIKCAMAFSLSSVWSSKGYHKPKPRRRRRTAIPYGWHPAVVHIVLHSTATIHEAAQRLAVEPDMLSDHLRRSTRCGFRYWSRELAYASASGWHPAVLLHVTSTSSTHAEAVRRLSTSSAALNYHLRNVYGFMWTLRTPTKPTAVSWHPAVVEDVWLSSASGVQAAKALGVGHAELQRTVRRTMPHLPKYRRKRAPMRKRQQAGIRARMKHSTRSGVSLSGWHVAVIRVTIASCRWQSQAATRLGVTATALYLWMSRRPETSSWRIPWRTATTPPERTREARATARYLAAAGEVSTTDLWRHFDVEQSTMHARTRRMLRAGWLVRDRKPLPGHDWRKGSPPYYWRLTDRGRRDLIDT